MAGESIVSTTNGGARFMPPEELAMQSLTKQLYKSRLFRGHYLERCYVEQVGGYRDVIALQRSERELEKLLLSSAGMLQQFYQRFVPNMWVGITKGNTGSADKAQLDTHIWTELSDLAFGEYWFSIKTLRFRDQEVQIKLKMVRAVEPEAQLRPRRSPSQTKSSNVITAADNPMTSTAQIGADESSAAGDQDQVQIGLADFVKVLQQWGDSIKQTIYDFMANDVNKRNIMGTIRFLCMLIMSILGGAVLALRFLGIFVLRFLFELSRFTHTATPIVFKLIEFVNKIFGAFFILLTMIWKDLVVNRGRAGAPPSRPALDSGHRFKSITNERSDAATHRQGSRYAPSNYL